MNLERILEEHEMWLKGEEGGKRADLRGANLRCADLRNADLECADLRSTDLENANLRDANLECAELMEANLRGADLRSANLRCADLRSADLSDANLYKANLDNIITDMYTIGYHLVCPEEGSFVAYKKAINCLVKLLVLEDAKRSSATTLKCRCSKAKVLDIEDIKTGEKIKEVSSNYDYNFIYRVGDIITVDDFDDDRWNECAAGIHFFMNKENAINY